MQNQETNVDGCSTLSSERPSSKEREARRRGEVCCEGVVSCEAVVVFSAGSVRALCYLVYVQHSPFVSTYDGWCILT